MASNIKALTKPYSELKEQYKLFIEYFVQTQNATESLKKAGYKGTRVGQRAGELKKMLMPYIQDRLVEIHKKQEKGVIADTDEILAILTRIARGEEKDAFGLDTTNQDKLKALELLGKANQLYVERIKQDTNVDINVSLTDGGNSMLIEGEKVEEPLQLSTNCLQLEEGSDS